MQQSILDEFSEVSKTMQEKSVMADTSLNEALEQLHAAGRHHRLALLHQRGGHLGAGWRCGVLVACLTPPPVVSSSPAGRFMLARISFIVFVPSLSRPTSFPTNSSFRAPYAATA